MRGLRSEMLLSEMLSFTRFLQAESAEISFSPFPLRSSSVISELKVTPPMLISIALPGSPSL